MNSERDLNYLKMEAKELQKVLEKLKEQRTYLQLEELVLKGLIREKNVKETIHDTTKDESLTTSNNAELNLDVRKTLEALASGQCGDEEEEETEEEDDEIL